LENVLSLVQRDRDEIGRWLHLPKSYEPLLEFEAVRKWASTYQSAKTRDDYLRWLEVICKVTGMNPDALLALDGKEAHDKVIDVMQEYLQQGKTVAARAIQTVAKSIFEYHDKPLEFKRQERVKRIAKKVAVEIIPRKEQVHAMIAVVRGRSARALRDRAIIHCLFKSGVRVNCLLNWKVSLVSSQVYPEVKAPVRLKITNMMDTKLSGYGLPYYYTFLDREAGEALKSYLDARKAREGALRDDDYIFKTVKVTGKRPHTNKTRILTLVKRAAANAGLDPKGVWTHCLRKSFRKVLNASNVDEDTKEALMGHKIPGSRDNYFDKHDVDEVARKYSTLKFNPEAAGLSADELRKQSIIDFAKLQGVPEDKIRIMDQTVTVDQMTRMIREMILAGQVEEASKKRRQRRPRTARNGGTPLNVPYETRIVNEEELVPLLNTGWDVVKELASGKIIVRRSNSIDE
jgi:integrase